MLLLFPTRRIVREENAGEERDAKKCPDPIREGEENDFEERSNK